MLRAWHQYSLPEFVWGGKQLPHSELGSLSCPCFPLQVQTGVSHVDAYRQMKNSFVFFTFPCSQIARISREAFTYISRVKLATLKGR